MEAAEEAEARARRDQEARRAYWRPKRAQASQPTGPHTKHKRRRLKGEGRLNAHAPRGDTAGVGRRVRWWLQEREGTGGDERTEGDGDEGAGGQDDEDENGVQMQEQRGEDEVRDRDERMIIDDHEPTGIG